MAIVDKITGETIERLRGKVDFYLLRGILPVARRWPKKPKPPYTALQAEAMAVFKLAQSSKKRITGDMLEAWRIGAVGKREAWYDTYTSIIMHYWYIKKIIPVIALEYNFIEFETDFRIKWKVLQLYLDPDIKEIIKDVETILITKEDMLKISEPIYITLTDKEGTRLVAPYILFKIEEG